MNRTPDPSCAAFSREDLEVVAEAIMTRMQLRRCESERAERVRELLGQAGELSRALAAHTQHGLVDCQGSHGAWDLGADTETLFASLARYADSVRRVATEYRFLLDDSDDPVPATE
jgi:hypothetical protein